MPTRRSVPLEPAGAPLVAAPALRDQVYTRLRDAILSGDLTPGERISPTLLAQRFGTSVMPVRDALQLLEQEGLVETSPRRWTRVVELDPTLVEEVVPLVSVLEQHAVSSARSIPSSAIKRLRSANARLERAARRGDLAGCIEADVAFHDTLVALAGNRSLERAVADARSKIQLLRPQVLRPDDAAGSVAEHEQIIVHLAAGDRAGAKRFLRANWERGLRRFRARPQDGSHA